MNNQDKDEDRLFHLKEKLKSWRSQKATEFGLPAYVIFNNEMLDELVEHKPTSIEELSAIKGFGKKRVSEHGADILHLINEFIKWDNSEKEIAGTSEEVVDNPTQPDPIEEWLNEIF